MESDEIFAKKSQVLQGRGVDSLLSIKNFALHLRAEKVGFFKNCTFHLGNFKEKSQRWRAMKFLAPSHKYSLAEVYIVY